ncbi:nucleotide exchange factor GrpE [Alphaproteobacteria bacterium]|nr:nucleotide exchange factor GrpE [Alphaproteobacteria bacterium]MDC0148610.1 nucleotide exchange factor GrpE [Alphaproteobacteria bacterium]
MINENENNPEAENIDATDEPGQSADEPQTPPDDLDAQNAEAEAPAPQEPTPEEQLATMKDQLLRTLAELENTRRRAERDRGEALKYGAMNFARDMLSVADNMQRALSAAGNMGEQDLPDAVKAMLEGVAATERDLQASLQRHKVMPINPMGEKFDPNLHEAMFEAPGTGQPVGSIIEVIETGYMMSERLLRPAKVGIAKD